MMAATLAQIVGVETAVRAETEQYTRNAFDILSKEPLQQGRSRTFEPDEGRQPLPEESQRVAVNTTELLAELRVKLARMLNVTATKDWANSGSDGARADVKVDGHVLIHGAPAPYLLFLVKWLNAMQAGIRRLPVQSPAEDWSAESTEPGIWRTPQTRIVSTTRETDFRIVVPETQHHAADVREITRDARTGEWVQVKFTSAIPLKDKTAILERLSRLTEAVQFAIHDANRMQVEDQVPGDAVLGYVFTGNGSAK